jgi:hypothetical protein
VIDQLVAARLLVVQTRTDAGGGSVEIVHESLIDRWPTLRRWLDEGQEDAAFLSQLAAAAKQWEAKGRASGLLWRGDAMEEARRWYTQRPRELPPREHAFLGAVFALAQRGKRAKRIGVIAAFVTLTAVAAGALVAFVWIRGAEQQATENAARAEKALADIKRTVEERDAAEAQARAASEKQLAAEAEKQQVEAAKQRAESAVELSREELKAKNEKLEKTLVEARAARAKAEQAAAELKKAKDALQAANAKQQAEINHLKEETRKLTTKLR